VIHLILYADLIIALITVQVKENAFTILIKLIKTYLIIVNVKKDLKVIIVKIL